MKKVFVYAGIVAAAAAAGGATAWGVVSMREHGVEYVEREVVRTPGLGTQFTAYEGGPLPRPYVCGRERREGRGEHRGGAGSGDAPQLRSVPRILRHTPRAAADVRISANVAAAARASSFREDGYIVTNNHVVDQATKLRVKLNDGRVFDARTVGTDPATDVALIKIEAADPPTLPFGSSDALRLGEWVLAIGSPFDLQSTITAGIVSAKARQLRAIPDEFSIESFIQTDAAVNPGNSGGALVNTHGELVGINTLIKSQTGSYIGYSFAIPESIVRKVVVDLKEYGVVQRARCWACVTASSTSSSSTRRARPWASMRWAASMWLRSRRAVPPRRRACARAT